MDHCVDQHGLAGPAFRLDSVLTLERTSQGVLRWGEVQVECQGQNSFNRLKINNLDYILELVRLGQIGLTRLGIWRMRLKIRRDDAFRPRRDKLSQALACLVETIEFRSPTIVPY